jgi:hypothetical protein
MQCDAAKQRSCAVHAGTYATRSNNAAATPAAGTPASSIARASASSVSRARQHRLAAPRGAQLPLTDT